VISYAKRSEIQPNSERLLAVYCGKTVVCRSKSPKATQATRQIIPTNISVTQNEGLNHGILHPNTLNPKQISIASHMNQPMTQQPTRFCIFSATELQRIQNELKTTWSVEPKCFKMLAILLVTFFRDG